MTEKFHPQGADSILDILNEEPQWQGRIHDAYQALTEALNQASLAIQAKETLEEISGEGRTNLNYVFADNGADKVYTNVKNLKDADYDSVWERIDQDSGSYMILTPEEGKPISIPRTAFRTGRLWQKATVRIKEIICSPYGWERI